jgi:hypothetical protein
LSVDATIWALRDAQLKRWSWWTCLKPNEYGRYWTGFSDQW